MNKILHRDISINNILLASEQGGQRCRGLLIDYDYAFWYKDQDLEDADASASEHTNQSQEVLLHRTVSITVTHQICRQLTVDNEQGTLPFMSTELLVALTPVEHSEKHDLESFFWVLVFIITMYEGPNRRSDRAQKKLHPFGHWIQLLENIDSDGTETRLRAFGAFRMSLFSKIPEHGLFSQHIHPCFRPLADLVDELARAVFKVVLNDGEEYIISHKVDGT